jgi:RNA polymerase sigma factor (sigma-70 family)
VSSEQDFEAFFEQMFVPLYRQAWVVLLDAGLAEEVAQEALARTYLHWSRVRGYDRPDLWVRRVVARLAIRSSRLRARERPEDAALEPAYDHDPVLSLALRDALTSLTPRQRTIVVLHYWQGWTLVEVARALRIRGATARVHLHDARTRLREALEEVEHGH